MSGERLDSWLRRHERVADAATALLLGVLSVLLTRTAASFAFTALLTLPLVLRRRWPVECAVVVLAVTFVQWLVIPEYVLLLADISVLMVIHALAAYGPRWAARVGLAAGLVGAVLGGLTWPPVTETSALSHVGFVAFLGSSVTAAWAVGALRGVRGERVVALVERARLLEIERDQQAMLAVSAERARIAREMHDVVAHSLAVVIAQADGGWFAAESSTQAAQAALATIGDTGRGALLEMRRLLGVLRQDPAPDHGQDLTAGAAGHPGRLPQPGIDDIAILVKQVRASGLDVGLSLEPPGCPVEPGLELVAYRIVQEGLTNVLKHAGRAARAEVVVRWGPQQLEILVLDDGRGLAASTGPGGHGVMGMRERAAAYDGTVWVGPRPGGGHAVHARIPVPA